ncbi:Hypothetical predicted protein [Paramuricea clavata]|uniref:Uncharacterized protein n=1 Tax=Paramuricea clavata TaxID=317549 RepID=A0A6S7K1J3_PARCT|nr:Hypothetical predicted protein [Paramuricea clavata]
MAGANLIGIKDIFGNEALERVKTCEFHYKQNVNRRARLIDAESAEEFKKCEAMLQAQTEDGFPLPGKNSMTLLKPTRQSGSAWYPG